MKKRLFILLLIFWGFNTTYGDPRKYNHPELEWFTIETEHFMVHYHAGTERTASLTAKIAEDIYEPITSLYQYEPDTKISFIIRDHDDNSNGAAFYLDNKVEIWAPAMDFHLRGTHNWLRNVLTHEFSHMISLGAARKLPRQAAISWIQWFGYEPEKREDVLHGYPNTLVYFPITWTICPLWFAEGMAQFQRRGLNYDNWDAHRDMLLRTSALENKLYTLFDMTNGGGDHSVDYESAFYNQGYAFTSYIAYQYGEETLNELVDALHEFKRFTMNSATEKVLGITLDSLYQQWSHWIIDKYQDGSSMILENQVQGEIIESKGIANFYPEFSPDNKSVAYISSKGRYSIYTNSVYVYNFETKKSKKIKPYVHTTVSWAPDSERLVYVKQKYPKFNGSRFNELFIYNLETEKEKQLTWRSRAKHPTWSPDGSLIAAIVEIDGTSNLVLVTPESADLKELTQFKHGEQLFTPDWLDNETLVFAISESYHGRDIATINIQSGEIEYLLNTANDERDPTVSPDGSKLYYSCDKSGIFNIYEFDFNTKITSQITNVIGGAFMPTVNKKEELVYSLFTNDGYKLAYLTETKTIPFLHTYYVSPYQVMRGLDKNKWDISKYDDTEIPEYESKPYKPVYSKMSIWPRLIYDWPKKMKIGTYFLGSDILDKINIFGTAAFNFNWDWDIFGIFEYKLWYPTLFAEYFNFTKHRDFNNLDGQFKLIYNLMEFDLGANWQITDYTKLRTAWIYSQYRYDGSARFQYQRVFGKFSSLYHKGQEFQFKLNHHLIPRSPISDIAPNAGRKISLEVKSAYQSFADSGAVHKETGLPIDIYTKHNYTQVFLDWNEFLPGFRKSDSWALRVKAGWIDKTHINSFYHFYAGGMDGLRGYPFYSMEGRKLAHIGAEYRFPIMSSIGKQVYILGLDKLYMSVYAEAGNAWNRFEIEPKNWKKDVGVELRLSTVSFYALPLNMYFNVGYGLDKFVHKDVTYGHELRYYFGMLFSFWDLIEENRKQHMRY